MSSVDIARESILAQSVALAAIAGGLGQEFDDAIRLIFSCNGRVIVIGMGKSGIVGQKIAATLASTGTPSFYIHPADAIHGDLGMITPQDVLLLISNSGGTEEVVKLLPSIKYFGNKIISLVGRDKSPIGDAADVNLVLPVEREVCPHNLAPTTSALVAMAVGDALAVTLMKAKNFKPADFAHFHPGGMLGKSLHSKVRDVMRSNDLPLCQPDDSISTAVMAMTSSRLGLVVVQDNHQVVGIFTDGDLRRAMVAEGQVLSEPVKKYMSANPVCVMADDLIKDAEILMREHKVRALVVVSGRGGEHERICGILDLFGDGL
ncbi:arabinose-5-phosphate isomerase [Chromatiales bacterium (ex Bugula neritina AB1)]|nr:arabinose-5-phosphate isomerase [Chromatiales bacterium (ex Bugula neritina AB1)]